MPVRLSLFFLLTIVLFSCAGKDKKQKTTTDQDNSSSFIVLERMQYKIVDSLPLFNPTSAYSYINLQKLDSGIILAFQHPNLNLDAIDVKGRLIRNINKKGDLPENFHGDYLEMRHSNNKMFYVMDEGAAVWLKVYDGNFKYVKTIDLHRNLKDYTVPPVSGGFIPISINDSIDRFIITPLSTSQDPNKKDYYDNPVFIQFDLNLKNYLVTNIKKHLKLSDINSISENISKGKKKWEDAVPLISFFNDKFYVKFSFDNDIYVYDTSWSLLQKHIITPQYAGYEFATDLKHTAADMNESFRTQMWFQFSNLSYNSMSVFGNKLYLLYSKPIAKDKIPISPQQWQNFLPTPVLHILDISNEKQYSVDLPNNIFTYYSFPISDSTIYLRQHAFSAEDLHVYKVTLQYQ